MNVLKLRALAPFALALLVGTASVASAQAPSVTATVNGSSVSVQWTPVAGATLYDVIVTGSFNGTVELAATSFFVATAPPGTYNIQVRGKAGSVLGPLSTPATVTVGGAAPGCPPPGAPTLTVTVTGTQVSLNWTAVDGAAGYRVEIGQSPGGTALAQVVGAGQLGVAANSPFFGTFYARVVAGNACGGLATSNEEAFTVGQAAPPPPPPGGGGSGPRAADPVPGAPGVDCTSRFVEGDCMLPVPGYAAGVVAALAAQFPGEAAVARPTECRGGNNNFLFRVLRELRKLDTRWGLNYKRGNAPTLSEDIITYNGTNRPDEGESHVILFDIVGGSCFAGIGGLNGSIAQTYNGTWNQRGQPYCGTTFCAKWTLAPYIAAGFTP